jgi:hypothetical protein
VNICARGGSALAPRGHCSFFGFAPPGGYSQSARSFSEDLGQTNAPELPAVTAFGRIIADKQASVTCDAFNPFNDQNAFFEGMPRYDDIAGTEG